MKITVTERMFRDSFIDYDRKNNFSFEGLGLLYKYLEELEKTVNEMELDAIALCCDYRESSISEVIQAYNIDLSEYRENFEWEAEDDPELETWELLGRQKMKEIISEYLSERTTVVGFTSDYSSFL